MINRKSAVRGSAIAAVALAFTLGMTGCSALQGLLGGDTATRDEETDEVIEGGNADVFTGVNVGDCFNDEGTGSEISELPVVPCNELHDNEVFFKFDMEDGEWPGDDAVGTAGEETCGPEFEKFAGIAEAESTLSWFAIQPTEETWTSMEDREIICSIYEYDEAGNTVQVEGTLQGAAR